MILAEPCRRKEPAVLVVYQNDNSVPFLEALSLHVTLYSSLNTRGGNTDYDP